MLFILFRYIGRQFLTWFFVVLGVLTSVVMLFEIVELLRRGANKEGADFAIIAQLALYKMPLLVQELIPFTVLFAAMIAYWRMTKSQELVVARAAGISVWQFLLPTLSLALMIGALQIMVFNPLAATMFSQFEQIEAKILKGRQSSIKLSKSGLWLRQPEQNGHTVIHADNVASDKLELYGVTLFHFEGENDFVMRHDSATATLKQGFWYLTDCWITSPTEAPQFKKITKVPTSLTPNDIRESFASPQTLSFWDLPDFIALLEKSGFTAQRHWMQWHKLLALPFLLCAVVLIAAPFSLKIQRQGGVLVTVLLGVCSGFLLFLMSQTLHALGEGSQIPVMLAAWTPVLVSAMIGVSLLLHQEDG